ncbi:MAG: diaminopimelate decarboxylase [bacterium]
MHFFKYKNNHLYCDDVKVEEISKNVSTPFYLYSSKTILHHYHSLDKAFKNIEHKICYSVKANSNLAILKLLADQNAYFDIVSGGELYRLIKIKVPGKKIVFAGVGKTREEIELALKTNILMFTVESIPELELIHSIAKSSGKCASIALRINPDIEANTHHHITTGKKENKFGIDFDQAIDLIKNINKYPYLKLIDIQSHIGTQITQVSPSIKAITKLINLIKSLKIKCEWLDIGGGFGIIYNEETPPNAEIISKEIIPLFKNTGLKLMIEPGRFIVGNAGILVTKILYLKKTPQKNFVIVDAAMTDLIRPSFYDAFHQIIPVIKKNRKTFKADIVGPVCESGDFFAKDRNILEVKQEELLAIMSAGAYGFTMASNYNSRKKVAEVLTKDDKYYVIRKRETYKDLIKGENAIIL